MTEALAEVRETAPLSAISVDRSLHVLNGFLGVESAMTLTELSRRLAMPKSTVFRLITQLTESGYLERIGRKYRLSLRVFQLGNHYAQCGPGELRELAAAHMGGLFQHTGLAVSLAVRDGLKIVYLDRIRGPKSGATPAIVGGRMPALTTALGKAIVAFDQPEAIHRALTQGLVRRTPFSVVAPGLMSDQLAAVRSTGVAFDRQESMVGLACVAAPIMADDGTAVAAISLSGPAGRFKPEAVVPLVSRASQLIAADMRRQHGWD